MNSPDLLAPLAVGLLTLQSLLPGAAVATTDPRDAALAALVADLSADVIAAAQGLPSDPRWNDVGAPEQGLSSTPPETVAALAGLGAPLELVVTVLEIEALIRGAGEPTYVRTNCAVFADGRVRWLGASARPGEVHVVMDGELEKASPELAGAVDRMVEGLRHPECTLPVVTPEDLAPFPEQVRQEGAKGVAGVQETCGLLSGLEGSVQPRIDDISVLVRAGERFAVLKTGFEVVQSKLGLYGVTVRDLENRRLDTPTE